MDPAFCVGTMEVLPENHLLVRKETEPKKILELIADNPAQLIVEALESYPNKATTAIDLEITLAQVVGEEKFKKWWADARKAVAKDPRVAVPEKKTECYVLRETPGLRRGRDLRAVQRPPARPAAGSRWPRTTPRPRPTRRPKANLSEVLKGVADAVKDSNQIDAAERLYGAAVRDRSPRWPAWTRRPSSPRRPRSSPTCATCRPSPRRSPSSSRGISSSSSRRPTRSSAATSCSTCSRSPRASSRPSASISWSRTATPRTSPRRSSAGRPSRTCGRPSSSGSSRTGTPRSSRSC
jgi:hypothetical protein